MVDRLKVEGKVVNTREGNTELVVLDQADNGQIQGRPSGVVHGVKATRYSWTIHQKSDGALKGVYGSPRRNLRKDLWYGLSCIATNINLPWLITGILMLCLMRMRKKGGSNRVVVIQLSSRYV
ncbi:hypothetical protein ERO13_D12G071301v2 [Gossypium hirsutum]|uniref:Uncharacterized protein n=2 Tax=Gossypium TaxID=3633 RepID=A0ABM3B623_GOSHI|nr:uncharacterized protein LOC121224077 [Gossypium hirsutum]KAG4115173.1 hypothetical protein ERO13_D12G071301v2 [Gossypium hirsutum]TYI50367.1 hypothetical protein E1A91_D12G097400v1 [Gossypium mustelinum]